MSWILLEAITDSRHQGWAIKYFSVIIKIRSICEQPFYDIIMMILHINKSFVLISNPNLQMFVKSIKKFPLLRGTRAAFLLPARTCWMVMGQLLQPQRLPYMARMTNCWHVGNKLPKYEVLIFTAQKRNHWRKRKGRASVLKNGLPNWCDWILCQCQ